MIYLLFLRLDSFCIDWYKTPAMDKTLSMVYLPIGMKLKNRYTAWTTARAFDADVALDHAHARFFGPKVTKAPRSPILPRPCASIGRVFTAAFGNKEQLFRKVLDRYASGPLAYFRQALGGAKGPGCCRTNSIWRGQDGE